VSTRHSPRGNEGGGKEAPRKGLAASCDEAALKSGDGIQRAENGHAPRLMSLGASVGEDVLFKDLVFLVLGDIDKPKMSIDGKLSSGGASAEPSPARSGAPRESATQVSLPKGCRMGSIAGDIP